MFVESYPCISSEGSCKTGREYDKLPAVFASVTMTLNACASSHDDADCVGLS